MYHSAMGISQRFSEGRLTTKLAKEGADMVTGSQEGSWGPIEKYGAKRERERERGSGQAGDEDDPTLDLQVVQNAAPAGRPSKNIRRRPQAAARLAARDIACCGRPRRCRHRRPQAGSLSFDLWARQRLQLHFLLLPYFLNLLLNHPFSSPLPGRAARLFALLDPVFG